MIVCTSCGHENDDGDEFCGSCGDFLEWSGESAVDEQAPDGPVAATVQSGQDSPTSGEDRAGLEAEGRAAAEERARAEAEAVALIAERARAEATAQAAAHWVREAEVAARKAAEATAQREAAARAKARAAAQARADEELRAKRVAEAAAERSRGVSARAAAQAEAAARAAAEQKARTDADANAAAEASERAAQQAERAAREDAEASAREQAAAHQRAEAEAARAEAEAARTAEAARRAAALVARPPAPPTAASRPGGPRKGGAKASTPDPEGSALATGPVRPGRPTLPSPRQPSTSPEARRPGRPKRDQAPARPPPPPRSLQPGDLICGQCGEGNDPARKFCRRCGASLVEAAVAPEPAWWRRLLKRRRKVVRAGERPGRQAGARGRGVAGAAGTAQSRAAWVLGKGARILALLGVLGISIGAVGPWRGALTGRAGDAFGSIRRAISPQYDPARPFAAIASTSLPDHDPKLVIDGISSSYWAEGAKGDGEGQQLVLRFDRPVDLDRIGITSGASQKPEAFLAQPRPERLHLVFSGGSTADIKLKDSSGFQSFAIKARRATSVEVQIQSVYKALGGTDLAITEIELFTKA